MATNAQAEGRTMDEPICIDCTRTDQEPPQVPLVAQAPQESLNPPQVIDLEIDIKSFFGEKSWKREVIITHVKYIQEAHGITAKLRPQHGTELLCSSPGCDFKICLSRTTKGTIKTAKLQLTNDSSNFKHSCRRGNVTEHSDVPAPESLPVAASVPQEPEAVDKEANAVEKNCTLDIAGKTANNETSRRTGEDTSSAPEPASMLRITPEEEPNSPRISERKNLVPASNVRDEVCTPGWKGTSTFTNEVVDRLAAHSNENNSPHPPGTAFIGGESDGSSRADVVDRKAAAAREDMVEASASAERPHGLAFKIPAQKSDTTTSPSPDLSLLQIAPNGGMVTKKHFFEVSSHSPVQEIAGVECTPTLPFQGQIGSVPVQWSQIVRDAGNYLLLTYKDRVDISDGGDMRDEGRQHLEWEANVLTYLRAWCKENGKEPDNFPNPIGRQNIVQEDSHVLWLNLTSERDSSVEFDVIGTLEDVMHMHARFNIGNLPESISAHLVSQVLECVGTLHRAGVTHNDLGLDSFLLVRRKLGGEQEEWFLVCTGLGSKAIVCKNPAGNATNDSVRGDEGRRRSPFKRDLYGVANIVHLLLSGGSPLAWKRGVSEPIVLQSTRAYSSMFMRGQMAWESLFQTLLNPTDETCSLDLAESGEWNGKMASATNMIRTVSGRSEQSAQNNGFFNELMGRARSKQADSFAISPNDRFPVKLIVRSRETYQGNADSEATMIVLERNISRLAAQQEELELNLEEAYKDNETSHEKTKEARQEAEAARKELREAACHSQDLNEELQELRLRHDALRRQALKQEQGFKKTIAEKNRALSTLRNRLQQGQVTGMAEMKAMNDNLNSRLGVESELEKNVREKMVLSAQLESAKCTIRIHDDQQEKANQNAMAALEAQKENADEPPEHLDATIAQLQRDLSESRKLMEEQTKCYEQAKHLLEDEVSKLRKQIQDLKESFGTCLNTVNKDGSATEDDAKQPAKKKRKSDGGRVESKTF